MKTEKVQKKTKSYYELFLGISFSTARACFIMILDPESAIVGLVISVIQQILLDSIIHELLGFLEDHVKF